MGLLDFAGYNLPLALKNIGRRWSETSGTGLGNQINQAFTRDSTRQSLLAGVNSQYPDGWEYDLSGNIVPTPTRQPRSQDTQPQNTGTDYGYSGGTSTPQELPPAFLEMFNGNYFTSPDDYFNAILAEIDAEANRTKERGRKEFGRSRSSLLEQVARLMEDLGQQETEGQANIDTYYGGLGDIYQSSQGVRKDQFGQEVGKERGRIKQDETKGLQDLDRQLNEYLEGVDRTRQANVGKTFGDAFDIRQQFASSNPATAGQVGVIPGAQVTDQSALLKNLNSFLAPSNLRQRFAQATPSGNVSNYLNPLG